MSVRARRGAMRRAASAGASALVAVALCVATCAARVGVVAADGASWSEDLDGLDEFLLDSPRLTEKFLQEAVRAERAKPEFNASDQPKLIFPGGKLHDRAMRVGADRGMLRLGGPPPVEPPALAGEAGAKGAAALSASRVGAGNATLGEDGSDGKATGQDEDEDEDLIPYVANAWGSDDVLGGLFVGEEDANASAEDAGDGADLTSTSRSASRRARRAARMGEVIVTGAVATTGALLPANEWAEHATEKLGALEVPWLLATELAEAKARADPEAMRNETAIDEAYAAMQTWFEDKGGAMHGVRVRRVPGKPGDGRGLVADEGGVESGARFLRVPASLTLSPVTVRNMRSNHHSVGEHLKKLYGADPERALAIFLLHEWLKEHMGEGSKWGPYLRTLRSPAMGRAALRAMAGTYASEVHAEYRADATRAAEDIQYGICLQASDLCKRRPGEVGSGTHTRDDFRWALGVVRSRAVWVRKRTTGAAFLALVPFLDLVPHHPRAGGEAVLELDSAVSVAAGGAARAGAEMAIAREARGVTDAESLCRWHHVTPGPNDANGVRLKLPGAEVTAAEVHKKVLLLRQWRKEMAMPPRGADLWRGAVALGLYGDGDEELEAMKTQNSQSASLGRGDGFAALAPNGDDGLTVEEELMLTGQAATPGEAASVAATFVGLPSVPFAGSDARAPKTNFMLYAVPDADEPGGDAPELDNARKELARAALQTQAAAAFGEYVVDDDEDDSERKGRRARRRRRADSGDEPTPRGEDEGDEEAPAEDEEDELAADTRLEAGDAKPRSDGGDAAAEALRDARAFFESGVPPPRGLDALDLFLLRKGRLMSACGPSREYMLRADGPSPALMCATRALLANETELAALEGGPPGAEAPSWSDDVDALEKRAGAFDAALPLSAANERAALRRLATAATNVLLSYATTEREDLDILGYDPDDEDPDEDENADVNSVKKMPRALRTEGGVTRAAVAARLREKRLLKAAMFAMSRREREVDALAFQVDARAAEKRDAEAALAARKKRAAALAERYNTPLVLATLDVEVVQSEAGATEHRPAGSRFTASAVVREGDDIEAIARAFAEKHAVDASAVPTLIAALQPGTPARAARADAARARLVAAVPVVVPSGAYGVLAMREGDDLQDIARVFAGLHEIPEASIPGLVADANATLALRARLPVLLRMPLTVPDGRSLALEVREGDQHGDLPRFVERWCIAERVPRSTVAQVTAAVRARLDEALGTVKVSFPLGAAGRLAVFLEIRTTDPERVTETVRAFCETHDLGVEAVPGVVRNVLSRLDPGAVVVDVDPESEAETTEGNR